MGLVTLNGFCEKIEGLCAGLAIRGLAITFGFVATRETCGFLWLMVGLRIIVGRLIVLLKRLELNTGRLLMEKLDLLI